MEPPLLRALVCPDWTKLWISCSWLKGFNWDNNLAVSCYYKSENCNQKRQKTEINHSGLICGQCILLHLVAKAFSTKLINAQVHMLAPPPFRLSPWDRFLNERDVVSPWLQNGIFYYYDYGNDYAILKFTQVLQAYRRKKKIVYGHN